MKTMDSELQLKNGVKVELDDNVCNDENINKQFFKCECISEVNVTSDFILHLDTTKDSSPNILVATATKSTVLYNLLNSQVAKIGEYKNCNNLIGCRFSNRDTNLFYTGSSNGSIELFDSRKGQQPVSYFKDNTNEGNAVKTFNCFDVSSNDKLLTACTDAIDGDAFIVFWDARKPDILGAYWQCHTDDITQVKFHPEDMNKLISGSTDGLINLYDLKQKAEDNALIDTLNTNSSIDQLSWYSSNSKLEKNISCITYTSDLQLWDLDGGEPYVMLSRMDIANKIMINKDYTYLAKSHATRDGLLVLAGSKFNEGDPLRGLTVKKKNIEPYVQFESNKQIVRDSSFIENNNILIAGGEKGNLNIWKIPEP